MSPLPAGAGETANVYQPVWGSDDKNINRHAIHSLTISKSSEGVPRVFFTGDMGDSTNAELNSWHARVPDPSSYSEWRMVLSVPGVDEHFPLELSVMLETFTQGT